MLPSSVACCPLLPSPPFAHEGAGSNAASSPPVVVIEPDDSLDFANQCPSEPDSPEAAAGEGGRPGGKLHSHGVVSINLSGGSGAGGSGGSSSRRSMPAAGRQPAVRRQQRRVPQLMQIAVQVPAAAASAAAGQELAP